LWISLSIALVSYTRGKALASVHAESAYTRAGSSSPRGSGWPTWSARHPPRRPPLAPHYPSSWTGNRPCGRMRTPRPPSFSFLFSPMIEHSTRTLAWRTRRGLHRTGTSLRR